MTLKLAKFNEVLVEFFLQSSVKTLSGLRAVVLVLTKCENKIKIGGVRHLKSQRWSSLCRGQRAKDLGHREWVRELFFK